MKSTVFSAILYELNQPLRIEEIELPTLLRGQVLIKIFYSGVCRSQLMESRGGRGEDPWLPHMLGHEGAGQVVAVGDGVTKVSPGDDVILGWVKGDGLEAPGAIYYTSKGEKINSGRVTTFSNYSVVSENRVYKKPQALPYATAVLFGCALPTGAGMVFNELEPSPSDVVAVLGLGGIGISALVALLASGIKNVVAIDVSEEKLGLAKRLGVKHLINSSSENTTAAVERLYPGGIDACIESAGSIETIELGLKLIRVGGGRLLFASHPPEGELIRIAPHELISGKQIAGSWGGASIPDNDIPKIYDAIRGSESILEFMLSEIYPLSAINDALDDLESGKVFRPLIEMPHDETE